ncbi:MAG TPA: hypothetical protein VHQ90_14180 [Thermoanaerobaculia bacterium]|nr:hypothetical protein [Thermoanaerobaculia bacterium]
MKSSELFGSRCLAMSLFVLAPATAVAGPAPILKAEVVSPEPGSTGTLHFAPELRLSVGSSAPLILRSDLETGRLVPIPGPQYPIGDHHVLLLGWSSYGSGMETIHALLLHVENDRVILQRELALTTDRSSSALLIRRDGLDTILLGIPERGPSHNEDEWSLVFGAAKVERLDSGQIRKLPFVAEKMRSTDLLYTPPFQSVPHRERFAWLSVSTNGFTLLTRARSGQRQQP